MRYFWRYNSILATILSTACFPSPLLFSFLCKLFSISYLSFPFLYKHVRYECIAAWNTATKCLAANCCKSRRARRQCDPCGPRFKEEQNLQALHEDPWRLRVQSLQICVEEQRSSVTHEVFHHLFRRITLRQGWILICYNECYENIRGKCPHSSMLIESECRMSASSMSIPSSQINLLRWLDTMTPAKKEQIDQLLAMAIYHLVLQLDRSSGLHEPTRNSTIRLLPSIEKCFSPWSAWQLLWQGCEGHLCHSG